MNQDPPRACAAPDPGATGAKKAGGKVPLVRRFEEKDIAQVTDMHRRLFRHQTTRSEADDQAYGSYFRETFLDTPGSAGRSRSLVFEDRGQVGGFLGVINRTMSFDRRRLQVAVSSQFMVADRSRSTLAAIQLLKAFLAGPQDLSLADEASSQARRIWEGVGGTTAVLYSLSWVRVLRPAAFVLGRLRGRGWPASLAARALIPMCRIADAAATRLTGSPFRPAQPSLTAHELDSDTLRECIDEAARDRRLRPEYDDNSLRQLLEAIARKRGGRFEKALLRDSAGMMAGWYLYHTNDSGIGEVLQVGARSRFLSQVLDHLFDRASRQGVTALCGRLDPRLTGEFADRRCFFHHRGQWVLVHSTVPRLLEAIQGGDAFLSRLDGEWPLRYQAGLS